MALFQYYFLVLNCLVKSTVLNEDNFSDEQYKIGHVGEIGSKIEIGSNIVVDFESDNGLTSQDGIDALRKVSSVALSADAFSQSPINPDAVSRSGFPCAGFLERGGSCDSSNNEETKKNEPHLMKSPKKEVPEDKPIEERKEVIPDDLAPYFISKETDVNDQTKLYIRASEQHIKHYMEDAKRVFKEMHYDSCIVFVFGNTGCDLDSACSAIGYAAYRDLFRGKFFGMVDAIKEGREAKAKAAKVAAGAQDDAPTAKLKATTAGTAVIAKPNNVEGGKVVGTLSGAASSKSLRIARKGKKRGASESADDDRSSRISADEENDKIDDSNVDVYEMTRADPGTVGSMPPEFADPLQRECRFIPIINTKPRVFKYAQQQNYWLDSFSVDPSTLIFWNDLKTKILLRLKKFPNVRFVMVDHCTLDPDQKDFIDEHRVLGVLDHHVVDPEFAKCNSPIDRFGLVKTPLGPEIAAPEVDAGEAPNPADTPTAGADGVVNAGEWAGPGDAKPAEGATSERGPSQGATTTLKPAAEEKPHDVSDVTKTPIEPPETTDSQNAPEAGTKTSEKTPEPQKTDQPTETQPAKKPKPATETKQPEPQVKPGERHMAIIAPEGEPPVKPDGERNKHQPAAGGVTHSSRLESAPEKPEEETEPKSSPQSTAENPAYSFIEHAVSKAIEEAAKSTAESNTKPESDAKADASLPASETKSPASPPAVTNKSAAAPEDAPIVETVEEKAKSELILAKSALINAKLDGVLKKWNQEDSKLAETLTTCPLVVEDITPDSNRAARDASKRRGFFGAAEKTNYYGEPVNTIQIQSPKESAHALAGSGASVVTYRIIKETRLMLEKIDQQLEAKHVPPADRRVILQDRKRKVAAILWLLHGPIIQDTTKFDVKSKGRVWSNFDSDVYRSGNLMIADWLLSEDGTLPAFVQDGRLEATQHALPVGAAPPSIYVNPEAKFRDGDDAKLQAAADGANTADTAPTGNGAGATEGAGSESMFKLYSKKAAHSTTETTMSESGSDSHSDTPGGTVIGVSNIPADQSVRYVDIDELLNIKYDVKKNMAIPPEILLNSDLKNYNWGSIAVMPVDLIAYMGEYGFPCGCDNAGNGAGGESCGGIASTGEKVTTGSGGKWGKTDLNLQNSKFFRGLRKFMVEKRIGLLVILAFFRDPSTQEKSADVGLVYTTNGDKLHHFLQQDLEGAVEKRCELDTKITAPPKSHPVITEPTTQGITQALGAITAQSEAKPDAANTDVANKDAADKASAKPTGEADGKDADGTKVVADEKSGVKVVPSQAIHDAFAQTSAPAAGKAEATPAVVQAAATPETIQTVEKEEAKTVTLHLEIYKWSHPTKGRKQIAPEVEADLNGFLEMESATTPATSETTINPTTPERLTNDIADRLGGLFGEL